ncbi:MAG: DUF1489 family protein [Anaerovoracaceae bacterium]
MTVHLLKTAAGLQEIDQLIERQAANRFKRDGALLTYAYTRYAPKRAQEIIENEGSIYWILKNRIQVRQRILGFEMVEDTDNRWCKIVVEPQLTLTVAVQKRAIQGWRYLESKDAPKDRGPYFAGLSGNEPPPEMADELRRIGLL